MEETRSLAGSQGPSSEETAEERGRGREGGEGERERGREGERERGREGRERGRK